MKKKQFILNTIIAAVLSFETALSAYFIFNSWINSLQETIGMKKVCICAFLMFWVLLFVYLLICKHFRKAAALLSSAFTVVLLVIFAGYCVFLSNSDYKELETDQSIIFAGHRVMLIVPHEDDDINVLGGILEQYAEYGSEVYTVFVTNGDYNDLGKIRINEAIECMEICGVPEDHVIFLGYGDQWSETHIYNTPPIQ